MVDFSQPEIKFDDEAVCRKDWEVFPLKFEGSRYVDVLGNVHISMLDEVRALVMGLAMPSAAKRSQVKNTVKTLMLDVESEHGNDLECRKLTRTLRCFQQCP